MKNLGIFLTLIFSFQIVVSQETDNLRNDSIAKESKNLKFNYKQVIIPALLVGYGVVGLQNNSIKQLNFDVKKKLTPSDGNKIIVDDYTQFLPLAATFGLEALGVPSKNNFKDKAIIAATATLIMSATVFSLKKSTSQLRPDQFGFNSFPSGHTATAFMGAELMYQEYKDQSIWYGVSGYAVAATTGYLRMYNNRHWLTDVLAGAGIGIVSAKAAYWLYPCINKMFKPNNESKIKTVYIPYYDGKTIGVGLVSNF
jgi:PAP2 superfamily